MNKTNPLIAIGLMILATACKEDGTVKPQTSSRQQTYVAPQRPSPTGRDSVHVLEATLEPVNKEPVPHYYPQPKQDVMLPAAVEM